MHDFCRSLLDEKIQLILQYHQVVLLFKLELILSACLESCMHSLYSDILVASGA